MEAGEDAEPADKSDDKLTAADELGSAQVPATSWIALSSQDSNMQYAE